jgi:hypothetical protein
MPVSSGCTAVTSEECESAGTTSLAGLGGWDMSGNERKG